MIKGIIGNNFIRVTGGTPSTPYVSTGAVGSGMVRWNSNMSCLEINDGCCWVTMPTGVATVDLDTDVINTIEWAKRKMLEEQQLDELCKKYPGLDRARSNFETFKQLVFSEESLDTTVQSSP
jgi:hypothetical protein